MLRESVGSVIALTVLFAFLFIISFLTLYYTDLYGAVGLTGIIILEAVFFLITWLVSPKISSWLYKVLYGLKWLSHEEFAVLDPKLADFVMQLCKNENIPLPQIGLISDDNPQSFTFGSDRWNARLVITHGVIRYLDENERKAVVAHEIGHIVHRDFIVMTLAAFILTVLYTIGRVFIRTRGRKNPLPMIGAVSLLFYYIGSYVLLYLSRMREYWADDYSKEKTGSGNYLSSALVKIAYGIVSNPNTEKTHELMEGTRTLGVYDHNHSKAFGLVGADYVIDSNSDTVTGAIAYDLHNLWAFWGELTSSHPLTGKRIVHLTSDEAKPVFNVQNAVNYPFDREKHYSEFARDLLVSYLWLILGLIGLIASLILFPAAAFGLAFAGAGLGLLIRAFYKYPSTASAQNYSVGQLMMDVYASPARGRPCVVSGSIIGRGTPGYVFSEDLMFQDKTGLLYFSYRSGIPLIGDLIFAITKVKGLIGQEAECTGWFFRSMGQYLAIDRMKSGEQIIKSRQKLLSIVVALILLLLGAGLLFLGVGIHFLAT